jgi:hypothetical protein
MYLVNDAGGDTRFVAWGQMTGSQFDLVSSDGKSRLKGRLRNGVLDAEWIDEREGGRFQGTLSAERR